MHCFQHAMGSPKSLFPKQFSRVNSLIATGPIYTLALRCCMVCFVTVKNHSSVAQCFLPLEILHFCWNDSFGCYVLDGVACNMTANIKQTLWNVILGSKRIGMLAKTIKNEWQRFSKNIWRQTDPQAACEDSSSWCWVLVRLEASPPELAALGSHYSLRPARGGKE